MCELGIFLSDNNTESDWNPTSRTEHPLIGISYIIRMLCIKYGVLEHLVTFAFLFV